MDNIQLYYNQLEEATHHSYVALGIIQVFRSTLLKPEKLPKRNVIDFHQFSGALAVKLRNTSVEYRRCD